MVICEESNTSFDRTKLDKLTKLLEKLNEEYEDFRTFGTKQNARQDDAVEKTLKEKLDEDHTPIFNYNTTHHENNAHEKLKLPPVSKIPLSTNKKKEIRRQIELNIT